MSEKREGALFYDKESGRYDIRFGLDSYYGGLHCGDCFDLAMHPEEAASGGFCSWDNL
ncbi:hypothetical protein C808_04833 [Lachnospiraceae bacterium M18-1]|nr:hypothetical protein C808_04833 [Lachnospiraceae bacterium M18-1]